jgi:ABC-type ATPase with predicted acetyltransferase domain
MRGSEREMLVRARFGLPTRSASLGIESRLTELDRAGRALHERLDAGQIALITGPSGSGKSVALRSFVAASGARRATPISTSARRSPVSMVGADPDRALALLGAVGLGEARRLVTPAGLLSDGERARLALARAIDAATRDIACDEFTSPLDRLTARSVCACVRRALGADQRLVCASAHEDVAPMLDPDLVLLIPLQGPPEFVEREGARSDAGDQRVA